MIKPEQIPDEALEAAAKDVCIAMGHRWEKLGEDDQEYATSIARAAIAAAINAWPGGVVFTPHTAKWPEKPSVILPLPETRE